MKVLVIGKNGQLGKSINKVITNTKQDNEYIFAGREEFDLSKEIDRLEKQIQDMKGRLNAVTKKLDNKNFVERAPENVISHERNKMQAYQSDLAKLQQNLEALQ